MRNISRTAQFKRDYNGEIKGQHGRTLAQDLAEVLLLLIADKSLPPKYNDHALSGPWKDCRDCHLKPDLVLVYRLHGKADLQLIRLGSHSALF